LGPAKEATAGASAPMLAAAGTYIPGAGCVRLVGRSRGWGSI